MFNKLYALRYWRDYITTFSVLSAEATYPTCPKGCCHQQRGSNAQNKRAQSVLTFMARTTSTLLNGLRFTLRKALLSYMLTLTLCLQEYHISFLQALHQRYNLQTICYMGDPSPWRRRSSSVMDRHPKLCLPKWLSSSLKMVFVEIIFTEMAFVKSKDGLRRHFSLLKLGFVKSKNGLRRDHLRRNDLRQVQRWSSSTFLFVEMGFIKFKNGLRRKTTMLWLNILFLKYYTLMALRLQSPEQHLFVQRSQILIKGTRQMVGVNGPHVIV